MQDSKGATARGNPARILGEGRHVQNSVDMDAPADPYDLFSEDLRQGERLLWSGQPNPMKLLNAGDFMMIPFSLLWAGFAFFWEGSVLALYLKPGKGHVPIFMPIFGLPFCFIGFWLLFGRFISAYKTRKQTYYGVTDQRLVFLVQGKQRNVQFIPIAADLRVQKSVRPDGSGTLLFGDKQVPLWIASMAARQQSLTMQPMFSEIKDVDEVAQLIDRQQGALPKPAPAAAPV